MNEFIHPTAIVDPRAEICAGVSVGPWCLVDAGVRLESGVVLESRVHVYGGTTVGMRTRIFDGAIVGSDPQDLKYCGESSQLRIGADCLIREYCTLNRGTSATGLTELGDHVLLMAYVHVAHDCRLGNGAVLANFVQLGGHVQIGDYATIGGNVAIQQFTRIGAYSFIGGTLKVERDVPPASRALGNPVRWAGLNLHALRKNGFSLEHIHKLEQQFRVLFRSGQTLEDAVQHLLSNSQCDPLLQAFFADWKGGLIRPTTD
jgi:UDP-N-acetylglucosamine acyltransferase